MRKAAGAGVGGPGQSVLGLGVVERVVEPRDRAGGIAEGWMRRHVVDALAVDIDLAPVAQAGEVFRARERPPFYGDGVLGFLATHRGFLPPPLSRQEGTGEAGCQCA